MPRVLKHLSQQWYSFNETKGSYQKLPPVGKYVIVKKERKPDEHKFGLVGRVPPSLAVGYRKNAAGDSQSPYFIIPGAGGKVIMWCDCLPNDFKYPYEEGD